MWYRCLWLSLAAAAALSSSGEAVARFSESQPIHHFFNARLLRPNEHQISIYTNYKLGITETLEAGTNGLLFLAGMPNIAIKHEMFRGKTYQTSFSSHAVYLQLDASQGVDTEETDAESIEGKTRALLLPVGIINTLDLTDRVFLNTGLFDYFYYQKDDQYDASTVFHIVTPVLGVDWYITESLALTALTAYPFFLYLELNSDVAEISGFLDFTKLPPEYSPSLTWLTLTYSFDVFNIEFGRLFVSGAPATYVNLFWRWNV